MRIAAFPKGDLESMVIRRSKSVFAWIDEARTLGVDGLELHTGFFWSTAPDHVDRVGEAIAAAGLLAPMMCAAPDFTHPDPGVRAIEVDRHAEFMRVTARLGGPGAACRVLSGQAHPGVPVEQGIQWAAEAIGALLPLAAELDIVLALENHYKATGWAYPELAQRPEHFHALLDRVDERVHFGVQFDPSNALVAGADPADFLLGVVDRVVTMQASDRYLAAGTTLRHGVIGRGLNDYDRIFAILVEHGYDGWISIEDGVNGLDELRASADFLRAARDRWFGGSTAVRVAHHEAARRRAGRSAS
jgi:sugar phosphate isomerase/epimerase